MSTQIEKPQNNRLRALSIAQFCLAYGISRAMFYNLDKLGTAPATINVGRRRLITNAAEDTWLAAMRVAATSGGRIV